LAFVILFIVETRGRTQEETAALFDGEDKLEPLTETRGVAVIDIGHMSTSEFEEGDFPYPRKVGELGVESYELRRPQLVLERDRVGYTKGNIVLSFDKRV
jgi:hypothetical protein